MHVRMISRGRMCLCIIGIADAFRPSVRLCVCVPLGFLLQPEADQGVPGPSGPEGADYVGAAAGALAGAGREAGGEARGVEHEAAQGGGPDCARGARESVEEMSRLDRGVCRNVVL